MKKQEKLYKGNMNMLAAIDLLEQQVSDSSVGLPEEIFLFISRMTPMVNVDLLVKNSKGDTLLSWRDDPYAGTGWHVPGGIIRFRETFAKRIAKVSMIELGCMVDYDPHPIAVNEIMLEENATRGHFISFLYRCSLTDEYAIDNSGHLPGTPGFLTWHSSCPDNLIKFHDLYRNHIDAK